MEYVTYDADGALTGSYSQDLHPDHAAAYIEVTAEQRGGWVNYKANDARTALVAAPAVDLMPTVADYTAAVQSMLDTAARAHNYDDVVSACSYAAAPNPFQDEGISFVTWRGACWAKCYELMAEVQAGQRAQPSIAELLAMMPERV